MPSKKDRPQRSAKLIMKRTASRAKALRSPKPILERIETHKHGAGQQMTMAKARLSEAMAALDFLLEKETAADPEVSKEDKKLQAQKRKALLEAKKAVAQIEKNMAGMEKNYDKFFGALSMFASEKHLTE
jgi:predicted GIY-YIG superfamily endonuclease